MDKIFDIIIIGAGPAGMTAAIYAGRAGKSVCIIDKNGYGGNIANSPKVENIPGFVSISGNDFATNMYTQMMQYPTIDHVIDEAGLVKFECGLFKVLSNLGDMFLGKTVIFATGSEHKKLDLPTKNIYYCALCDGPFFKNKNVVVVGSGNTGVTYALELATYCKQVHICDIADDMRCEKVLKYQIVGTENIIWHPKTTIKTVHNNKSGNLDKVLLENGKEIKCSAIFAAIGLKLNTDIMKDFVFVEQTAAVRPLIPGVFVAGDCKQNKIRQVVSACSDGAVAATEAINYLNRF